MHSSPIFFTLSQFYAPGRLLGNSSGNPGLNATYDYVIVGAGLAGSLTASRITQALSNMTVAVVEAGSFYEISNGNYSQIPYYFTKYVGPNLEDFQPLIDWGLFIEPIPGTAGRRVLDWPNVEYVMDASSQNLGSGAVGNQGSIGMLVTSTTSTGNVTIQSADNAIAPILYIGWLDSAIDQEIAVAAVKRARSIASHISASGKELSPGSNVTTDTQILGHIKRKGITAIHHGAATCAMGRNASSGAVVDSQARVFGVTGLRVIDTSSLPFSAPGHTRVTYAHAEKLAQDVIDAALALE